MSRALWLCCRSVAEGCWGLVIRQRMGPNVGNVTCVRPVMSLLLHGGKIFLSQVKHDGCVRSGGVCPGLRLSGDVGTRQGGAECIISSVALSTILLVTIITGIT